MALNFSSTSSGIGLSIVNTIRFFDSTSVLPTCMPEMLILFAPSRVPTLPITPGRLICGQIKILECGSTSTRNLSICTMRPSEPNNVPCTEKLLLPVETLTVIRFEKSSAASSLISANLILRSLAMPGALT